MGKNDVSTVRMEERATRADELRYEGLTLRAIGDELGVSHETARKDLARGMERAAEENEASRGGTRAMWTGRLETAAMALWPRVQEGEEKAGDTFVKYVDRIVGGEMGFSRERARVLVKEGHGIYDKMIVGEVGALRAKEAAHLDALHDAWMPAALDGDPKAAEIVLKVRADYRKLTDADLVRNPDQGVHIDVINTTMPAEALQQAEVVDEARSGELPSGG